jgi:hypothetical protein
MCGFKGSPSQTISWSPYGSEVTCVQRDLRRDDVKTKTLSDDSNISVKTGELGRARQLPLYREI